MREEEKLINLNIRIKQNEEGLNDIKGIKLKFYKLLYEIHKLYGLNKFWDILFTILEFIQLMAFPMDKIFNKTWGIYWVNTIGNFFRFFQLILFWRETTFFIVAYIITCIFIIILLSFFFYILINQKSLKSDFLIKVLVLILQIQIILNIPFLRTLFSIFSCENNNLEISPQIKCKSGIHIFLIIMSIILIIIFKCFIILFHLTLYEFRINPNKLKSGYTPSTEILLDFSKLILIILYQFISHEMTLAIITLLFSIIVLFHFLTKRPFSNGFTMKLYLTLYLLFCWSCVICIISIFLKNSEFKSGIILLSLGYPLIIIIIVVKEDWHFSIDRIFKRTFKEIQRSYQYLLDIEYFLKLEENLSKKSKTGEHKLLYSYILSYEINCTENNCFLKKFMKIPLKEENYEQMKVLLLQHGEMLYRNAISKCPYDVKLRISYILFLFKKLNQKSKVKNELFLLNKFETNLETSFLIYKVQRYIDENSDDKDEDKEIEKNNNFTKSTSYKSMLIGVKSIIENILLNYINFWNILMSNEGYIKKNFIKMSKIGEEIKILNKELNEKIKSLEVWNIIDQDTFKIYVKYLKEIITNNEKANIYSNHISENHHHKHQYDEMNLYELKYKELAYNEDYKYIIIDCSKNDFYKICNISFSVCKLFGYTKEELIGNNLDILFPDIFKNYRKKFFQDKVNNFKKNLIIHNKKINAETWIDDNFGKNKLKYLIPFKAKWTLISTDDEKIYGIGNIILENKKIMNENEHDIVYILTDKNLIIQNFTSNATKILNLNFSTINNNCNIINYIIELNEQYFSLLGIKNNKAEEESNISSISNSVIKTKAKIIIVEFLKQYNYLGKNAVNVVNWKMNEISDYKNKYKKSIIIQKIPNIINESKQSSKRTSIESIITSEIIKKQTNKKIISKDNIKQTNLNETNNGDMNNSKLNSIKPTEKKINLKINEAKFNNEKIGYIFIFFPYNQKTEQFTKNDLIKAKESGEIYFSDISLISFFNDKKSLNNNKKITTSFNINPENSDDFFKNINQEKNEQFTFNITNMSYNLFMDDTSNNNFFEECRQQAINKITSFKTNNQEEESEEEEESYESENTSDESELIDKKEEEQNLSQKESKKNIGEIKENSLKNNYEKRESKIINSSEKNLINQNNIMQVQIKKTTEDTKKNEENNFYHVNASKITYLIYNFSSGYAETVKRQNYKISQVTYVINKEKEKLKNSNSIYIANTKFMKGKKKGIINKKEENEINPYSSTSLKLKEIYEALSSKEKEKSIIKLLIISIIIFIFIIGTGLLNILIHNYLKNQINNYYILIEKSSNLYQNLLFEITLIREMLILNNSYYTNQLFPDKILYYKRLSNTIYDYYSQNAAIISTLTNHFNILSEEDEKNITNVEVDLYIIDQRASSRLYYQYKKYTVFIYSAYRELNSALYHISQLKMDEIYQYNGDVYYFMKNGMSNILIDSEKQVFILTDKFNNKIYAGQNLLIVCCAVVFFVYFICSIIFIFFYNKVKLKKEKYLSIFNELDKNLIILSLIKCEKFTQKLQKNQDNNNLNNKNNLNSTNSSSINITENDNDNQNFINEKKIKDDKISSYKKDTKEKNNKNRHYNIFHIILFLILFAWQIGIYIYYYREMFIFKNLITYNYYISKYASNFLYIFISLREYIFDKKAVFYNKTIDNYLDDTLANYYVIFSTSAKMKDLYRVYFPESYQVFLNYLYNRKICEFINTYIEEVPDTGITECNQFFYKVSNYGFFTLIATFIEEIRALRVKIDDYYNNAEINNFKYNETFLNDPKGYYELYYEQYNEKIDLYKKYNPANILGTQSHKLLYIIYLYINTQVYNFLISESLSHFEIMFSQVNSIIIILNILFLIFVFFGILFIWIPLVFQEKKNISKIKNMLYIIPSEILINLPNINVLLGIEDVKY